MTELVERPLDIIFAIIGIVILVAVVASLFTQTWTNLRQLETAVANTTANPLMSAINPIMPWLTGLVLLLLILVPILVGYKKFKEFH